MRKKVYIIPFVDVAEICFEHLMTGTATDVGGTGGGRVKGRDSYQYKSLIFSL